MTTVIIPAYKAGWCLERSLRSISKQTRKPDIVMIGIDGCHETLPEARRLADHYNAKTKRAKDWLRVESYWFPINVGPYRVRNTLAMLADSEVLHTFDADDEMFPEHLETMEEMVRPGVFATPRSVVYQLDGSTGSWDRAHGVICITKLDLIAQGGWEPWRCAADTEALQRWQQGGLMQWMPGEATMAVYKHAGGLTRAPATGTHSEFRDRYKDEYYRRQSNPIRRDAIGIAECVPVSDDMDMEPRHPLPLPMDDIQAAATAGEAACDPARNTELHRALRVTLKMLAKRGLSSRQRAACEEFGRLV